MGTLAAQLASDFLPAAVGSRHLNPRPHTLEPRYFLNMKVLRNKIRVKHFSLPSERFRSRGGGGDFGRLKIAADEAGTVGKLAELSLVPV